MSEFKAFAMRGSVIDLAVGVVIGGAFGKIVTSLVDDIITPAILAPVLKYANLQNLADLTIPGTAIKYGSFLSTVIQFTIIAFALFIVIRFINRLQEKMKKEKEAADALEAVAAVAEPTLSNEEQLLTEIRDLLKKQN